MTTELEKGLGEMRDSPLSSSLLLHHLLVQFAVHKCSQKLHQVLPPLILNKKHQFPQFAWPAAQPGCEFGLGLGWVIDPVVGALGWWNAQSLGTHQCLHTDGFWLLSMSVFPCSHLHGI